MIRPFNVAGPRQSRTGGFVMPTFVQQAIANRPLTVFAGGGQERAFLSATDLARFVTDHVETRSRPSARSSTSATRDNSTTVWNLAERIVARLEQRLTD